MVRKKSLREEQMSEASVVNEAKGWAGFLVRSESRGPGDTDNAMRRVARRYGVPHSTLWALRYRAPKDLLASVYLRLRAAYEAERERQLARLADDLAETRRKTGAHSHLYRAAAVVAGAQDDEGTLT